MWYNSDSMHGPFERSPASLRRPGLTFDNIALIPASLLPFKDQYQAIANHLPKGTVLLVLPRRKRAQRRLLVQLANRFAARGHQVATRTSEEVRRL
jgi:hypothetical protein